MKFKECHECYVKVGSPTLCNQCLWVRKNYEGTPVEEGKCGTWCPYQKSFKPKEKEKNEEWDICDDCYMSKKVGSARCCRKCRCCSPKPQEADEKILENLYKKYLKKEECPYLQKFGICPVHSDKPQEEECKYETCEKDCTMKHYCNCKKHSKDKPQSIQLIDIENYVFGEGIMLNKLNEVVRSLNKLNGHK